MTAGSLLGNASGAPGSGSGSGSGATAGAHSEVTSKQCWVQRARQKQEERPDATLGCYDIATAVVASLADYQADGASSQPLPSQ